MAQRKTLLIVDDDPDVREGLAEQLGLHHEFMVVQAVDGADGVKKLDTGTFDLVISDINMPNMDGIALTKHIRLSPRHKFTPVLILTTESQAGKMQEGKAAGATGWIVKPFDPDKLAAAVRRVSH